MTNNKSQALTSYESAIQHRDDMMEWLKDTFQKHNKDRGGYFGGIFIGTASDFYGVDSVGIHLSAEDNAEYNGQIIYDYYSQDYKKRDLGVLMSWEKKINSKGYYSEWYDSGTVILARI